MLFVLSDDVVRRLKMPLETLLVSERVSASLSESDLKGDEVEESSGVR